MAKGNFLTSIVTGKLGNMVGYRNSSSNDREKQAWRSYNSKIRNPKSEAQARQRMIMRNLTGTYSELKPILSRSWEGVQYGAKSYSRFLQVNMVGGGNGPWVPKDNWAIIPATYRIAEGSLTPVAISAISQISNRNNLVTSVFAGGFSNTAVFGTEVVPDILETNPGLREGDQLTFIDVSEDSNNRYRFNYRSIILDTNDTRTLRQVLGDIRWNHVTVGDDSYLTFYIGETVGDWQTEGGAVIVSRKQADGSYLRSTTDMWVNLANEEIAEWYSAAYLEIALQSYMNAGDVNSDWPTEAIGVSTDELVMTQVTLTIAEGRTVTLPVLGLVNNGVIYVLYKNVNGAQRLLNQGAAVFTWPNGSGQDVPVTTDMLASGTQTMVYSSSMGSI